MRQPISKKMRKGLVFLAYMRLVTIDQFAFATELSRKHCSDWLHSEAMKKNLGTCGDQPLDGNGRAPKVYYLKRKGWAYYTDEELIELGDFVNSKPVSNWSQGMKHRLNTVTLTQRIGRAAARTSGGGLVAHRFDFKKERFMGKVLPETQDYTSSQVNNDTRLVPDAAFFVKTPDDHKALMFLETDMGTEGIKGRTPRDGSIETKLRKYERYLASGKFQARYADWHNFPSFRVLLVTTSNKRIANIRNKLAHMDEGLHDLFRFTTHEAIAQEPMGSIWVNRNHADARRYGFWE